MLNLRHFAAATLFLAALGAPAAARAQTFPGVPLPYPPPPPVAPPPPGTFAPYAPASLAEAPPPEPGRYEVQKSTQQWYGWQILIPTLVSDAMIVGGVVSGGLGTSNVGPGIAIAGLVGHGSSGPIVHLAHGRPLKALASLGLEAGLPAVVFATAFLAPCHGEVCAGNIWALVVGVPVALTAGAAIDASALAWEDRPSRSDRTGGVSFTLAPLVLPPLKVGSLQSPKPAGAALVGTF